jgi:hypothetical protein
MEDFARRMKFDADPHPFWRSCLSASVFISSQNLFRRVSQSRFNRRVPPNRDCDARHSDARPNDLIRTPLVALRMGRRGGLSRPAGGFCL